MPEIKLREIEPADIPLFFDFQADPDFNHMAAFTTKKPTDRAAFDVHWAKIMANDAIPIRTILVDGEVVGSVLSYIMFEERNISYSMGKADWGKGYATAGLKLYLAEITERPLVARAAKDNYGSIRVLEKCGFVKTGEERFFAEARGEEIDEVIMHLK